MDMQRNIALVTLTMLAGLLWSPLPVSGQQTGSNNRNTAEVLAYQRVKDTVVNLRGRKTVTDSAQPVSYAPQVKRVNGMGTGVIIDPRGYILTNYHVIDGIQNLIVTSNDATSTTGSLISYDHDTDLAIIKIDTNKSLPTIPVGSSTDIMTAETVLAVGNAYGYTDTASRGIVSQLKRTVPVSDDQIYYDLIQTDASINPGNSGGPLINLDGEMIGINVAVRVGAQGIGFAIPVNKAMEVAANLFERETGQRIFHGISVETTYPGNKPLTVISRIAPNSPATAAGLQVGDRLVQIAGFKIDRQFDFQRSWLDLASGQSVAISIERQGKPLETKIQLEQGRFSPVELVWETLGLEVRPESPAVVTKLNEKYAGGLTVEKVRPGSPAKAQGIQPGDILVGLHEWETVTVEDLNYIIRQPISQHQEIMFYILRSKQAFFGKVRLQRPTTTAMK